MNHRFLFLAAATLVTSHAVAAPYRQRILDGKGQPGANLPVRAQSQSGEKVTFLTTSDADGWFTFDLDETHSWLVEVDPVALLNAGYFCVPGSIVGPGPRFAFDDVLIVPLRPVVTPVFAENSEAVAVELNFDWAAGMDPDVLQTVRVEKSTNFIDWEPIGSVLLSNPPLRVIDSSRTSADEAVFYRAVQTNPFQVRPIVFEGVLFDPNVPVMVVEGLPRE